ncbi:MAG: hypothetical protein ACTSR5_09940 [Promethearchaeota archaeon]
MTQIEIKKGMNEEEIELFVGQVLKELSLKEKVHLMSGKSYSWRWCESFRNPYIPIY